MKILNFERVGIVVKVFKPSSFDYKVKICYELREIDELSPNELEDILTFSDIFNNEDDAVLFATSKLVQNIKKQIK